MSKISVILFAVVCSVTSAANIKSDNENPTEFNNSLKQLEIEAEIIKNITTILNINQERSKKTKNQIEDLFKQPQIPPVTNDPVQAVQSRIPCECKNGICSCCVGGFLFNNKGCMKIKYIPEDFAFELRMTFNDNVLYKNTMSGKNPRPICISPPRFDQWLEMCAKFHDIYFVGRNMHLCLDISATIGDYDLFDREFDCMKFGSDGVALVSPEDGGGHPGYPAVINPGTDAEIDAGGTDDIESYDEVVG